MTPPAPGFDRRAHYLAYPSQRKSLRPDIGRLTGIRIDELCSGRRRNGECFLSVAGGFNGVLALLQPVQRQSFRSGERMMQEHHDFLSNLERGHAVDHLADLSYHATLNSKLYFLLCFSLHRLIDATLDLGRDDLLPSFPHPPGSAD